MILFPYLSFVIETDLSARETMELLIEVVSSNQKPAADHYSKSKFKGSFSGNSFKFQQKIKYRNSFLPVIRGQINTTGPTTEVSIWMLPRIGAIVFMMLWLGIVCQPIFLLLTGENIETHNLIFSVGMFLFGYTLMTIGFGLEASKVEKELMGMFSEREIRNKSGFPKLN